VTGPSHRRVVASRLRGYRDALAEAGLEAAPELVEEADWTTAGGHAAAGRLLDRIAGAGKEPDRVLLPVELVVRGSCGAATPAPTGT
jgi:DNA-binding LacI/PurR family transcriptional regulator